MRYEDGVTDLISDMRSDKVTASGCHGDGSLSHTSNVFSQNVTVVATAHPPDQVTESSNRQVQVFDQSPCVVQVLLSRHMCTVLLGIQLEVSNYPSLDMTT